MPPQKKKVIVMVAVSLGIITFSYLLPVVIVPMYIKMSYAGSCTNYGCQQDTFSRCGGYQTSGGDSTGFIDSMSRGMKGMLCMLGLDNGPKVSLVAGRQDIHL
jgi:hypothetical protein